MEPGLSQNPTEQEKQDGREKQQKDLKAALAEAEDKTSLSYISYDKKKVSPLQRLLMDAPLETILMYLHQTGLQYTITRRKNALYWA